MANTFVQLSQAVAAVGGLDYSNEQTTSDRWAKGGLRWINREGAWEWLRAHSTFSLTGGTYAYSLATIASDFFRIDTRTLRYGDTYLQWGNAQAIDRILGPDWKDSGATTGTPEYATRVGGELWVAKKPSTAFVSDNPTIAFYYYRAEAFSGNLYLPDEFFEVAVDAALAWGFTQEDDPRGEAMVARMKNVHLPAMRAAKLDIGFRDQMSLPRWTQADNVLEGYGDGPVSNG